MIEFNIENGIGILKLNRPEKRNSLHPELVKSISTQLDESENDDNVKVLIITGNGTSFCAGADLSYLKDLQKNSLFMNKKDSDFLSQFFLKIYKFPKPTIAAVNGPAIAGGCGLATACDFILADVENSKFGYSEVKIGFLPAIVSYLLLKRVSEAAAKELLLTGKIINSQEAEKIGLINKSSESVLDDSLKLAQELIKNSLHSMIETKKLIQNISSMNINSAFSFSSAYNSVSRSSQDFINGLNSFLNKK